MYSSEEFNWEFQKEYAMYSSQKQPRNQCSAQISYSDSEAIRRAKAALDVLDLVEENSSEEDLGSQYKFTSRFTIRISEPTTLCGRLPQGTVSLYNFKDDYALKTTLINTLNKIVALIAAYLLSSSSCSLITSALNAIRRTPIFDYDAELSIDRHRLRNAI